MPGLPAARVADMTAHGSPLAGPGCPTVLIGGMPAWRGLSAAAAAQIATAAAQVAKDIAEASLKATALAGTPAGPAAQADLARIAVQGVADMTAKLAAGPGDLHSCPIVKVVVPDGPGKVMVCSQTVIIGGAGAARMGDPIQEATSVNAVAAGCMTVLIGG
jgi:uncharacterized Zn-binding protein involved in type VI secretion